MSVESSLSNMLGKNCNIGHWFHALFILNKSVIHTSVLCPVNLNLTLSRLYPVHPEGHLRQQDPTVGHDPASAAAAAGAVED